MSENYRSQMKSYAMKKRVVNGQGNKGSKKGKQHRSFAKVKLYRHASLIEESNTIRPRSRSIVIENKFNHVSAISDYELELELHFRNIEQLLLSNGIYPTASLFSPLS